MKHFILFLFILATLLPLSACDKFAATPAPLKPCSLFAGEGLISNQLTISSFRETTQVTGGTTALVQTLKMPFSYQTDIVRKVGNHIIEYRYIPSEEVFDALGEESKRVKAEYEIFYGKLREIGPGSAGSTIYYCGGMTLTADKDFAGIPAGEDLSGIVANFPERKEWPAIDIPSIQVPDGYTPILPGLVLSFPVGENEVVNEDVTFHIEIPVKVGMFLTLLKDRFTYPEAEMQLRDEILTCDFTIPRNLK